MSWEKVKLVDVCEIIAGQSPPSSTYNNIGNGLPFFQGKADFGMDYPKVRIWCSKPNKISKPKDILLSVRAPVGPTNLSNVESCIGRGLAAIRSSDKIYFKYIYYFFKSIESVLSTKGSGSTFSAITISNVKNIEIPLPPLHIQKQIANILDKADALRKKDQQLLQKYDELAQSIFIDMFGDPVKNEKGWEVKSLKTLGKLERGKSKHRPRNAPFLLGGKYPLVQTGDVANSKGSIESYKATYSEAGLKQSKLWDKGTLCITIAANIANTGILQFDACFPDSVVGFVPNENETNNIFIQAWFSFFQKIIEENAPEAAQKNINLEILRNLMIINPSFELQGIFKMRISHLEETISKFEFVQSKTEYLFQSLLQKAFTGELIHD